MSTPIRTKYSARERRTLEGRPTRLDVAANLAIAYTGVMRSVRPRDLGRPKDLRLYLRLWPQHTMLTWPQFRESLRLASEVRRAGIPGAIVECGTWRGGCSAGMATKVLDDPARHVWLFDSYEGMPEATEADRGTENAELLGGGRYGGKLAPVGHLAADVEGVKTMLYRTMRFPEDRVHVRKGWFQETLPKAKEEVGPIALLRVDGDWYESTKCVLDELAPRVVSGGYIVIDDYGAFPGCRKAVDEYRAAHGIVSPIEWSDHTAVWFRKP